MLHGTFSYILQDEDGQVVPTHSVSAGLDYPAVGPEHACSSTSGRVEYTSINDEEALAHSTNSASWKESFPRSKAHTPLRREEAEAA